MNNPASIKEIVYSLKISQQRKLQDKMNSLGKSTKRVERNNFCQLSLLGPYYNNTRPKRVTMKKSQ